MSYTVLARRYRSRTFDEVIGQEHVAQTLKRAIESGRIAHAFLFCGTRGTGKTSMARILAKALNCEKFSALAKMRAIEVLPVPRVRSEEHTSELQSPYELVCRLPLETKNG